MTVVRPGQPQPVGGIRVSEFLESLVGNLPGPVPQPEVVTREQELEARIADALELLTDLNIPAIAEMALRSTLDPKQFVVCRSCGYEKVLGEACGLPCV
jgi:hypothetical protein